MADTSNPIVSRANTFDAAKLYKAVRFQQGKPVLDTELNDLQDMTFEQIMSLLRRDEQFVGVETSPFEWAVGPVNSEASSARNNDNFAVTLGRLPTSKGVIDTFPLSQDSTSRVVYDYNKIAAAALQEAGDLQYANYMYKGTVSSVDAANPRTVFSDLSKSLKASDLLVARTSTFNLGATQNNSIVTFTVKSEACRIIFTSATNGANVGPVVDISSHTANQITSGAAFPADITVGDEYIIIPGNELVAQRTAWDAAQGQDTVLGSEANPLCVAFVQTWDEDISSNEDSAIELPAVGAETTHRTQLRWCVRIARLGMSTDFAGTLFEKTDSTSGLKTLLTQVSDATADIARAFGSDMSRGAGDDVSSPLIPNATHQPWFVKDDGNGNTVYSDEGLHQHSMLNIETSVLADESAGIVNIRSGKNFFESYRGLYYSQGITPSHFYYGEDESFLNWRVIKALVLAGLHTTIADIDVLETDIVCLAAWTAPSKRLHTSFLADPSNTNYTTLQNAGTAVNTTGADTLSPKWYPNTIKTFEQDSKVAFEHTRLSFTPMARFGLSDYDAQRAVFLTPPRAFLSLSEVSGEVFSSRASTYGSYPTGAFGLIQDQFKPAEIRNIKLIADKYGSADAQGRFTSVPRVSESLRERLALLETAVLGLTGLGSATELLPVSAVPRAEGDSFGLGSLQNTANKLLKGTHTQGLAQAGVSANPISTSGNADYTSLSAIRQLTTYENDTATIGGVFFGEPLKEGSSYGDRPEQLGDGTYKSRESLETNSLSYAIGRDTQQGWSGRASIDRSREWHEGLSSAVTFSRGFQFRKLAIKTVSHESADLFTVNVPMWWNNRQRSRIETILNADGVPVGTSFTVPDATIDNILTLDYQSKDPLTSASGAVRSHLARFGVKGPMGISSYDGVGYIPAMGSLNLAVADGNHRGYNKGPVATNTSLLPFLNKISGSQALSMLRAGYGEAAVANNPDISRLVSSDSGAWSRRQTSLSELVRLAKEKVAGTLNVADPFPAVSTTENRCTTMRLRYHIGDFYPGTNDTRGTPANLLVDSLNLFVRVEPLPLAHWMTMPKHQHSIIEGSLDMSEAIATLLDLSNGRGIPDHLFSLDQSFTDDRGNTVANSKLDVDYLIDSSAHNHRGSGLRSITSMNQLTNPTGNLAGAHPIMSSWLSRVGTNLLKLIQPAWKADFNPSLNEPSEAHLLSAVMSEDLDEAIDAILSAQNANYATDYRNLLGVLLADDNHKVDVGTIDPLRIAIPSAAQPHIHWYHPNMGAITAPNHGSAPLKYTDKNKDSNNNRLEHDLKYQPYPMWDRSSLVVPGIVPFDSALPQRFQMIGSFARDVNQDGTPDTWSQRWLDNDPGKGMTFKERFGAIFSEYFYSGRFDFDESVLQELFDLNILTPTNADLDTERAEEGKPRFGSFLPYLAHASGLFGPGSASITTANELANQALPNRSGFSTAALNAAFDAWANWFPYIVNPRLQNNTNSGRDFQSGIDTSTLGNRLKNLVFYERPRPVFFPAATTVFNNPHGGYQPGAADANDATSFGDPLSSEVSPTDFSVHTGDLAGLVNTGYHPFIRNIHGMITNQPYATYAAQFSQDTKSFSWDAGSQRTLQILGSLVASNSEDLDQEGATGLDGIQAGQPTDFDHPTMRAALSTHTVGWLNLYTKTYNETYGHDPLHPYGDLTTHATAPAWHTPYADSKSRTAGKGSDSAVDTLFAGDMGTTVATNTRNNFLDPLCFGMGAVRIDGSLVHDSDVGDGATVVVRDIFELASLERESRRQILSAAGDALTPVYTGLGAAYAAFSKMGMQNKLLYNCSFRVLHSRPGGAVKTVPNGIEQNYGAVATPPRSLTEMFLTVSADTNELRALPRNSYTSSLQKPYIQVEPMYEANVASAAQHPNRDWMFPLRSMVSDTLSTAMNNVAGVQGHITRDANGLLQGTVAEGDLDENLSAVATAGNADAYATAGDAFSVDPFDTAWDESIGLADSDKSLPVGNNAQNSGVEYELISSLARVHAKSGSLNLGATIGAGTATLQDTMVMPNELTLPGDHEIIFVLYTGDRGNQLSTDLPAGLNPPVAGCRLSATIEVNRPSERYDSGVSADNTDPSSIHYGVTTPSHLATSKNIEGIRVQTIPGGRPSLKL